MIKGRDLIVFGEDYARHPHSLEHLMRCLIPHNRVLWVETLGLRTPRFTLYDVKRSLEIFKKWGKGKKGNATPSAAPNPQDILPLEILSPMMVPFARFPLIRAFNRFQVLRKTRKALAAHGFDRPILITSVPQAGDFIGGLGESASIYFCVDDFSQWPGLDGDLVRRFEEKLLQKVDLVLATSQALTKSKQRISPEGTHPSTTCLLTHGVDIDHFLLSPREVPVNSPLKAGLFGLIDQRCDQDLLLFLLRGMEDLELTMIGNVVVPIHPQLQTHPRVRWVPPVDYAHLPSRLHDLDLFLLPYQVNEFTKTINPLKLKEYMSTGRPVISTAIPESRVFQDLIFVAENHEHFLKILKDIAQGKLKNRPDQTLAYLRQHETWTQKAREFSSFILKLAGEMKC